MDKRVVWLDISASYSHSSLALPAIESCRTVDDGYEWSVVRGTINSDIYTITRDLALCSPTVIAATLWLFNHEVVVQVCQRVKALLPNVVIILGGAEFNGSNEIFLRKNPHINYAFRGEGEIEFHRFLAGCELSSIKGLCYINSDGNYCDNATARVADFDTLSPPESSQFFSWDSPFVQIESSRGCFNNCAFCVSGGDKPVRVKSLEEVEKRIEAICKRGISDVRVLDRTFNYSPSRAEAMLDIFARYTSMNFHLEIHPALLTDKLCEQLSQMPHGVLHLEAGMQSLVDKVITASGRIGTNDAAIKGLSAICSMSCFETHADLIAGLPHYTLSDIFADVRELARIGTAEIQLELLKLLPGTRMRNESEALGIIFSPSPPYEVLQTPAITINELNKARLLSKLLDKFYNTNVWQSITRKIVCEKEHFLSDFLTSLISQELLERPLSMQRCGELLYEFCQIGEYSIYCDDISLAWIEAGLSLRAVQAGRVTKAISLPEGVERVVGAHYYLWQGEKREYIFCVNRSIDHSRPVGKWEVALKM